MRQCVDYGLLEQADKRADLEIASRQVEQRVHHHLAGTVIGNLAAAIDVLQRDGRTARQVLGAAGETRGVDRRVLQQPQFVRRILLARAGELAHRRVGRPIINQAQLPDIRCRKPAQTDLSRLGRGVPVRPSARDLDRACLQHHFDHRVVAQIAIQIIELLA